MHAASLLATGCVLLPEACADGVVDVRMIKGPVYFLLYIPCKHKKMSHRIFRHMHGVLNEVYLKNFLHGWAVNRETNLMSLFNS